MSAQSKTGKPTALSVLTRFSDEHCHYCILCLKVGRSWTTPFGRSRLSDATTLYRL